MGAIYTLEIATHYIHSLKEKGRTIVSTNGCFDLLHPGHIDYLSKARALGDYLIIGLNSDQSVHAIKGPKRPINSQTSRAIILSHLIMVDAVVIFNEPTPLNFLSAIKPHIHVKGGDYIAEHLPEFPIVQSAGGRVEILPFVNGFSTSSIIEKIEQLPPDS